MEGKNLGQKMTVSPIGARPRTRPFFALDFLPYSSSFSTLSAVKRTERMTGKLGTGKSSFGLRLRDCKRRR